MKAGAVLHFQNQHALGFGEVGGDGSAGNAGANYNDVKCVCHGPSVATPLALRQMDRRAKLDIMTEATLHFPLAEYQRRIAKTRKAMLARNLDLIVVSDPSNMEWLTGYDGWSFYVHQAVLLGLEGEPVWWGRGMDANGAKRTAFMSHDNIVGYPDHYVQSPERHPMEHLSKLIADRGWKDARIGAGDGQLLVFGQGPYDAAQGISSEANLHDSTGLVNWQRSVKSDLEVAFIRRAAKIVDAMHAKVFELVEPGLAKNVLVAEVQKQAILGADGNWGDYAAFVPMAPSGHGCNGAASHLG